MKQVSWVYLTPHLVNITALLYLPSHLSVLSEVNESVTGSFVLPLQLARSHAAQTGGELGFHVALKEGKLK